MEPVIALDIVLDAAEARTGDLSDLMQDVDEGTRKQIEDQVDMINEAVEVVASIRL